MCFFFVIYIPQSTWFGLLSSLFLFENSMELVLCVLNTVSYTVIEPLAAPEAHSFEVSYATQWKRRTKALNIGHRGMGKSFKDHSLKIE